MASLIRYAIAGCAILVCAWFAVGARQARGVITATQLINNATTERDPAVQRRAASALDAAAFLYPGIEVTLLRAQLDGNRRDYADGMRLIAQATTAEPDNLEAWIADLRLSLADPTARDGARVLRRLKTLDPGDFPAGQ